MARDRRGFTIIEMMVVIGIIAILTALGFSAWGRARIRSRLSTSTGEVQTAMALARARALSSGRDVAVMFYPNQATGNGATGRVIVYFDGDGGFMDGTSATTTFCDYRSDRVSVGTIGGSRSEVLALIDLPVGLSIGRPTLAVSAPFPFRAIPADDTGCSFCSGTPFKGAVRFDPQGRATFHSTCGAAQAGVVGGVVSVNAQAGTEVRGTSVLMILPTGLVRSFHGG